MQELTSTAAVSEFLTQSTSRPVIVFKHSTTCPISAAAHRQMTAFEAQSDAPIGIIRVIEERPVSLELADTLGVRHQSPQAIVVKDGTAVWHTSHYDITVDNLNKSLADYA